MKTKLIIALLLLSSIAIAQEKKIKEEDAKDGSYLILKGRALQAKRQTIVKEYENKLNADPEWKRVTEELKAVDSELSKLIADLQKKYDCKDCEIVWEQAVIREKAKN